METTDKNSQQKNDTYKSYTVKQNDSWMKRNGGYILTFAVIVIAGTWVYLLTDQQKSKNEYSMLESQYKDLSVQIGTRDSLINDWVSLFDQVEKDLQTIKEKEKMLSSMQTGDVELVGNKRETILRDIQLLNTLLADNKKKIESLNQKLKNSGMQIAGLEKKVDELSLALETSNQHIDSLKSYLVAKDFELSQLNTKLAESETTVVQKQSVIDTQVAELHKGYLASGTYKELKEKGLIDKEGGFLGVGRTKSLRDNIAASNFSEIDITQTTTIPVNSKKIKLITEHPSNSYELVKDENELIASINITNPDDFWRISKYAVVETIK
jgi:hypothetical protein